jgi:hypothetical protein
MTPDKASEVTLRKEISPKAKTTRQRFARIDGFSLAHRTQAETTVRVRDARVR